MDVRGQVKAVREGAGFLDRSERGKLLVRGADRQAFLHNMLSNAIKDLAPGQGCRAELLDDRGHVVADMRLWAGADDLLVDLEPGQADPVRVALDKFVIMDDVAFEDVTASWGLVTLAGTTAEEVLRALGVAEPPRGRYAHARANIAGVDTRIARSRWTGLADFELYVPAESVAVIRAALAAAGAREISAESFEALRVEAGIPRQGAELDDVIPLEAELEKNNEAVSLTKGCYLGQETLARIDARGHVNRILVGLALDGASAVAPGTKLRTDEKEVGRITSSVVSPTLGRPIALAYLRREHATPGTPITVAATGGPVAATVAALPFV